MTRNSDSFYIIYNDMRKDYPSIEEAEEAALQIVKNKPGKRVIIYECRPVRLLQSSKICQ